MAPHGLAPATRGAEFIIGSEALASLAPLGAALLHHWEVPSADSPWLTLNGGNVAQLNDRVGGAHASQGTAGNQPAFLASGGPAGSSYIDLQSVGRFLEATIAIGAANRVATFTVGAMSPAAPGAFRWIATTFTAPSTIRTAVYQNGVATRFGNRAVFTSGDQDIGITVPAFDQDWHLFASLPFSTGARSEIDGAATTNQYTGSNTMVAANRFRVGSSSGTVAGGRFKAFFAVDVSSDPEGRLAVVERYVQAKWPGIM